MSDDFPPKPGPPPKEPQGEGVSADLVDDEPPMTGGRWFGPDGLIEDPADGAQRKPDSASSED